MSSAPVLVVVALLVVLLMTRLRVNQPYERALVFRLGRLAAVRGPGLFVLLPLVDRMERVDLRTRVETFSGQELVTKDGLTLKIDFVLWLRVVDAEKAILEVANWWDAVSRAAETAMRDVVGQRMLSELLAERAAVNERIKAALDQSTERWGVAAERVEIKDIDIPPSMQRAMAREAEAVREKSARVIKAEGELEAATKLNEAANLLSPSALKVRELQTISEVGAEKNSVIVMVPMEAISGSATALSLTAARDQLPPAPAPTDKP